jgi:hypothetical protein
LDEVAQGYRGDVLSSNTDNIESFVAGRIPSGFEYEIRICEVDDICGLDFYKEEIYSSERIVSSNLTEFAPKKLKIFMWLEE